MSVSPHDFPDQSARDADPDTIPLGPQAASVQNDIAYRLTDVSGVTETIVQQSRPRGRGPIEFVLLTDDAENTETVRTRMESTLSARLPTGYIGNVQDTPVGRNEAVPRDAVIAGSVLVWRHPLLPHVESVVSNHGLVYSFKTQWNESPESMSLSPATTRWSSLDSLYVTISGPTEQLETVVDEVMQQTISRVPRPSVTTVNVYTTTTDDDHRDAADLPVTVDIDDGERVLEFGFTDRELMHDPASGVYNLPAEDLSGVVEHAASRRADPQPQEMHSEDSPDGVQLTITSPPYLDVIDYSAYADGNGADWSRKHGVEIDGADTSTHDDELVELWKAQQRQIFEQVFEATQDGGYCAVVIGHVKLDDEKWIPLPHEFSSVMRDIGWEFHERVIWRKIGSRASRFGTTIQHPKPTYHYPNQIHEEIMIWRKGDINRRKEPTEELEISELMTKEISNNVWHIPTVPHNKGVNHPCPFPEEIVHRLTVLYSYPGDIVVDPMVGSGTTVKVADRLDRIGVGTELQPAFVAEARRRLSGEGYTRSDQIIPSFDNRVAGDSDAAALTVDRSSLSDVEDGATGGQPIVTDGDGRDSTIETSKTDESKSVEQQVDLSAFE